jgi:putative transposase
MYNIQMLQGNRYRIYPNTEQKVLMEKHFGCTRFVYNKLLEIK